MAEHVPPGSTRWLLPGEFVTTSGACLRDVHLAYELHGRLDEARSNVVLVLTGLSPSAHIAAHQDDPSPGWWEEMVGVGKPIDTSRWHVICVNSLGSCKGSTGPASIDPRTGERYGLSFPAIVIEDIADAAAALVRGLGIERLACVVGSSMGAMTSLALMARHPGLAGAHVSISGAAHALPFAIAIRSLQREAVVSDPDWRGGAYDDRTYPERGMETARKIGLVSYRSAVEWDTRFHRSLTPGAGLGTAFEREPYFEVEAYLACHARRFARSFDPNSYLYLSRAIDRFDLASAVGAPTADALASLRLDRALVLGSETDILFPPHQQQQIADGLRAGGTETTFRILGSPQGHDAFLVDIDRFGPPVAEFLRDLHPTSSPRSLSTPVRRRTKETAHA